MSRFDNLFDDALSRADEAIIGVMGVNVLITSGLLEGKNISGVFDDPENVSYATPGVRIEGITPSLFVKSSVAGALRRYDTLVIGESQYWIDRKGPVDGESQILWLNTGKPPAGNRRR
ncbi:phage tail protein [Salmonella enterica subsp. enterica]|uniref:Phage tail protein n=1 Tax=Salmonella enterica subsp. enterica serovar Ank TaxID=1173578 RepID=A0A5I2WWZ9_SALET|nr:phage tail protein [Salmonella enterica subsp. enterica serovar Muenchen]EBV7249341.1 phage tail protein [Salmonella enterica subsp. enterica serovar Pomona]ECF3882214.1 phage tail protein [Salmonella enterica subsp. enterica serovar Ank]EDJ9088378.1 phage tail protein [Salmonella enterica subsp. enterica serovar Vitkin]EJM3644396.1 phage tail protein [Salmonella enterica]